MTARNRFKELMENRRQTVDEIVLEAYTKLDAIGADCFIVANDPRKGQTIMRTRGNIPWALGCFSSFAPILVAKFHQGMSGGVGLPGGPGFPHGGGAGH